MPLVMLVLFVVWLYALIESITVDESAVRNLPKVAWVFIILLLFPIGAFVWFFVGRPQGAKLPSLGSRPPRNSEPPTSIGPEDSLDFRRQVEDQKRLRQWEQDLAKREDEIRRQEGDDPTP